MPMTAAGFLSLLRDLDCIVVNHLEPDLCASMVEVLALYPNRQIVSMEKSFMLMHSFGYDIDSHSQLQVQEGDSLSFGRHEVIFIEAPMVHRPGVMVTLDLTDGVLFSANAFDSFKAIDGRLWADGCDWDREFLDEARRCHCNIVGKYGPHVQLLLKKAAGILDKIRIVAPLHGPLYRTAEDIMRYIDKLNRWASYTPEEKGMLVAYASM